MKQPIDYAKHKAAVLNEQKNITRLTYLYIGAVIALLALSGGWMVAQWMLCREEGMAFWYCVQHVL